MVFMHFDKVSEVRQYRITYSTELKRVTKFIDRKFVTVATLYSIVCRDRPIGLHSCTTPNMTWPKTTDVVDWVDKMRL